MGLFFKKKKEEISNVSANRKFKYGNQIKNLNPMEYQDKRDGKYLNALKLNEGFDKVMKTALEFGIDKVETIMNTGSFVRVNEELNPYVYECVKEACRILELEQIPQIYIRNDPFLNAYTTGVKNPILVLNDSLLTRLTHDELMFIIGHELGHIKSEHTQYHLIGNYIIDLIGAGTSYIPIVGNLVSDLVANALSIAYYDWFRKSELTADHTGLLVCQNLRAAISALAKLGGFPNMVMRENDIKAYLEQAKEFKELDENAYNKVVKLLVLKDMTHPWTVLRAKELLEWVASGEYYRILYRGSSWFAEEIEKVKATITNMEDLKNSTSNSKNILFSKEKKDNDLTKKIEILNDYLTKLESNYKVANENDIKKKTDNIMRGLVTTQKN